MASRADRAARLRVPLHFLLAALLLVFSRPTPRLLVVGAVLVAVGLAVRAWAAGHLRREEPLTVSGPYARLRHPLYFGSSFIGAGFAVAGGRAWLAALVGLYLVVFLRLAMRREEKERRARAADLYAAYAASVPMFLPRLRPAIVGASAGAHFDRTLYRRNREWRAALGCALLLAVLCLRLRGIF